MFFASFANIHSIDVFIADVSRRGEKKEKRKLGFFFFRIQ